MLKRVFKHIGHHPIKYIIGYATLIRVILAILYEGYSIFPDSEGYIQLANQLSNLDLSEHTGERTPGFPSLIALTNNNLNSTILVQALLGIINTYLLYALVFIKTKSVKTALFSAFVFTSFIDLLFYEVAILTETTALFLILVSFWYIKKYDLLNINTHIKHLLLLSILFSFSYLTRPVFIYIPIIFFMFYVLKNMTSNFIKSFSKAFSILIIPLIVFYSWSSFNEKKIGIFGSTYFLGINLAQTTTSFFEKAPDSEALIRDVFVKHRDSLVVYGRKHEYPMSIWRAYDELLEKTQLSPPELSVKLGEISKNLIKNHPQLYAKQVSISWIKFWDKSILWKPKQIKSVWVKNILMGSWLYIQVWTGILLNIVFLFFSIRTIIQFLMSKFSRFNFELLIILVVLLGSIAQAMVAYGSNSRFSFPYFSLIIYIVAVNIFKLKKTHESHPST